MLSCPLSSCSLALQKDKGDWEVEVRLSEVRLSEVRLNEEDSPE